MEENKLNAIDEEVVQPQREEGANDTEVSAEEIAVPQIDDMSEEDFESYIKSAQNGNMPDVQGEVQAEKDNNTADGTDDSGETGTAEPADVENEKSKAEPFKVFGTQEEYQSNIDKIIGERLKKSRESVETLEGLKSQALSFYGGEDADVALMQLIEDLQSQNAEKQGVSIESYKKQMQDSIDAQRYREEQSRQSDEQQKIVEIQSRWQRESEELKAAIPDFDFNKAMTNKTFYESIVKGMSVGTAYLAANKETVKPKRREISQNGSSKGSGVGKVEANPASMSDKDFAEYINRLRKE